MAFLSSLLGGSTAAGAAGAGGAAAGSTAAGAGIGSYLVNATGSGFLTKALAGANMANKIGSMISAPSNPGIPQTGGGDAQVIQRKKPRLFE